MKYTGNHWPLKLSVEFIKNQFPDIELNDLAKKIKEMSEIKDKITQFNDRENLEEKNT